MIWMLLVIHTSFSFRKKMRDMVILLQTQGNALKNDHILQLFWFWKESTEILRKCLWDFSLLSKQCQ